MDEIEIGGMVIVLKPRGAVVGVVTDNDGVVPRRPGEDTTVTDVVLDVADDGTLRDPMER